jgi:hypothetical protein
VYQVTERPFKAFLKDNNHNSTAFIYTEIQTVWIPRDQNTQADYLSRIIDIDDWAISTEFFSVHR